MIIGINRLLEDLESQGFEGVVAIADSNNQNYAQILNFEIPIGSFAGRIIDIAIPAPNDYPRSYGSSIQIRSNPKLAETGDSIQNVRNVLASPLGDDWRYWSYAFKISAENPTSELLTQINGIFKKN